MASFARSDWERRDFDLMLSSPVQMYWSRRLLEDVLAWLRAEGYQLIEIDAKGWRSEADLHLALEQRLSFPAYYGRNLDALNDCLSDFALYEFGSDPAATGTVLVLHHYNAFAQLQPDIANVILDIFASASRRALLIGHRMICLVR